MINCKYCKEPLPENTHGNRTMHKDCAYKYKKERQKDNYSIGNDLKRSFQKNERVLEKLHGLDKDKNGIEHIYAAQEGFNYDCPTSFSRLNMGGDEVYFFKNYGYRLKTINNDKSLIIIYHVSEVQLPKWAS